MSEYIPDDLAAIRANMLSDFKPRVGALSCSACGGTHTTQSEVKTCCVAREVAIVEGVEDRRSAVIDGAVVEYHVGQVLMSRMDDDLTVEVIEINLKDRIKCRMNDGMIFNRGADYITQWYTPIVDDTAGGIVVPREMIRPILEKAGLIPNFDYDIPVGNWVCMDGSGKWLQFTDVKPRAEDDIGHWVSLIGCVMHSHESNTPPWSDWKDSLFLMTENGLTHVTDNG